MDTITTNPVFLAVLAMALAGGILLLGLVRFGFRWFGNGGAELRIIKEDLAEIKADLKGIKEFQINCRLGLQSSFVSRAEFEEWKRGREDLWKRLNHHSHVNDKVVIGNR